MQRTVVSERSRGAGPGRPRDPAIGAAILRAAREVVAELGYEDTSLAAIARRAGVSIPTIYRRWSSKPALLEEAVLHLDTIEFPDPTGDLRADLETWVRLFLGVAMEPAARAAVPGLLAYYSADPDRYAGLLARGEIPTRAAIRQLIAAATENGEAAEGCDVDVVFDIIRGATFLRALTHADADADAFCARISAALLLVVQGPASQ
jgi:AcrR family transcriptional regulator